MTIARQQVGMMFFSSFLTHFLPGGDDVWLTSTAGLKVHLYWTFRSTFLVAQRNFCLRWGLIHITSSWSSSFSVILQTSSRNSNPSRPIGVSKRNLSNSILRQYGNHQQLRTGITLAALTLRFSLAHAQTNPQPDVRSLRRIRLCPSLGSIWLS